MQEKNCSLTFFSSQLDRAIQTKWIKSFKIRLYLKKLQKAANDFIKYNILKLQKLYTQSFEEMLWDARKKL